MVEKKDKKLDQNELPPGHVQCAWCYEIFPKEDTHNVPEGRLCDDCFAELYK